MTIVIRTLSERVFGIVRDRIVAGALPQGQPIRQDALAADLGISKIPLREALARLEQDGLLTSIANRGYVVRGLSLADAAEIHALRLRIEPDAAAHAAMVASNADRDMAMQAYEALAHDTGPVAEVARRAREFHVALVRPGGAPLTTQLVERLAILAERYVVAYPGSPGRDIRCRAECRALVDAWMARDAGTVAAVMSDWIRAALDELRPHLV